MHVALAGYHSTGWHCAAYHYHGRGFFFQLSRWRSTSFPSRLLFLFSVFFRHSLIPQRNDLDEQDFSISICSTAFLHYSLQFITSFFIFVQSRYPCLSFSLPLGALTMLAHSDRASINEMNQKEFIMSTRGGGESLDETAFKLRTRTNTGEKFLLQRKCLDHFISELSTHSAASLSRRQKFGANEASRMHFNGRKKVCSRHIGKCDEKSLESA